MLETFNVTSEFFVNSFYYRRNSNLLKAINLMFIYKKKIFNTFDSFFFFFFFTFNIFLVVRRKDIDDNSKKLQ